MTEGRGAEPDGESLDVEITFPEAAPLRGRIALDRAVALARAAAAAADAEQVDIGRMALDLRAAPGEGCSDQSETVIERAVGFAAAALGPAAVDFLGRPGWLTVGFFADGRWRCEIGGRAGERLINEMVE